MVRIFRSIAPPEGLNDANNLAALLESTGFEVVECRLLGEKTKAVYAVARKGGIS